MAQPPAYVREFNFASYQSANPSLPLPGPHVDNELNRIKLTLDKIRQNLALIQRDDGELQNESVSWDTLTDDLKSELSSLGFDPLLATTTPALYGATGDGVADDSVAVLAAWETASSGEGGIYFAPSGAYKTPGSFPISQNWVEPTFMRFTKATRLALFDGSPDAPNSIDDDPVFWTQKHTIYDNGTDYNAHTPSVVHDVIVYGNGLTGATDVDGTWIGGIGNAAMLGENLGTEGAPDYDARGNMIGWAGFARSEKPAGITAALWGYASTPVMSETEFAAYSAMSYPTVGIEINIDVRTPQAGHYTYFGGVGLTAGFLGYNYRETGEGVRDWSFGMIFSGSANDGNFSSTDIDNWNGFNVGVKLDFIKYEGILFGGYFKNGSYGIRFPDSYQGTQAPAAAIHLGNSKMQMGQYTGSVFVDNDFWHNGGNLFFRYSGASRSLLQNNAGTTLLSADHVFSVNGGWNTRLSTVTNAVNYFQNYNAAAGGAPAITVAGSDTNISLELRPKGTGIIFAPKAIVQRPGTSVSPPANGDLAFEFTNNTTVTVRGRGTDGTVRSGTITLS